MKRKNIYQIALLCSLFLSYVGYGQQNKSSSEALIGNWTLDLTPQDNSDNNFAQMTITKVAKNTFIGTFYNAETPIKKGIISSQTGKLYGALVSGDSSGTYNSSFYYKDGKLYGSTHSLGRNFLAVWVATKKVN